jgi:Asp/Glu/hydantoin racemase
MLLDKPHILIVNPNSTVAMTDALRPLVAKVGSSNVSSYSSPETQLRYIG